MKLYNFYGDKGFHSCITTSFSIDFDAYENIVLPRLRGAGCTNNLLIADHGMLTYALDGGGALPKFAGRHYNVEGVAAKGVFHPKLTLQLGHDKGRLIVSSANMSAAGMAGNKELAGYIECGPEDSNEARIIAAAWAYLRRLLDAEDAVIGYQLQWLEDRTPWLRRFEPAQEALTLADNSQAAFLTNEATDGRGIGARFAELVGEQLVERLIVLSPYWDDDLVAIRNLATQLGAKQVVILIDTTRALFPASALGAVPNANVFDLDAFSESRFIHAKALIAQTPQADHVLFGSANCTRAALGTSLFAGVNHEACLYRQLPLGMVSEELELDKIMAPTNRVELDDLPAFEREEEPDALAAAVNQFPGIFECRYGNLFWDPPSKEMMGSTIELLDANGMDTGISLYPREADQRKGCQFELVGEIERLAFARLRHSDGTTSALAIVRLFHAIREEVREERSKTAENVARHLSGETEVGLWLWKALSDLNAIERVHETDKAEPGTRQHCGFQRNAHDAKEGHRTLSYEQFIAGRHLKHLSAKMDRNSLADSELSLVRDFLNRVLSSSRRPPDENDSSEQDIARGLVLGDETGDAARALEDGDNFNQPQPTETAEFQGEETQTLRRISDTKASRDKINEAVKAFIEHLAEKRDVEGIDTRDVLRLRALLMIVAASGLPENPRDSLGAFQILPLGNMPYTWPRLMGRLIYAFFGGTQPAIQNLRIDEAYDQLPTDILECWGAVMWSIQAGIEATRGRKDVESIHKNLSKLAKKLYAMTMYRPGELPMEVVSKRFDEMNTCYAKRLSLDPYRVKEAHEQALRRINLSVPTA